MPKIKHYTIDTYRVAPWPNMTEEELLHYEMKASEEQAAIINEHKGATIAIIAFIALLIIVYILFAL